MQRTQALCLPEAWLQLSKKTAIGPAQSDMPLCRRRHISEGALMLLLIPLLTPLMPENPPRAT
eukprot:15436276-Alexandrium_andersonii.AAC.1